MLFYFFHCVDVCNNSGTAMGDKTMVSWRESKQWNRTQLIVTVHYHHSVTGKKYNF